MPEIIKPENVIDSMRGVPFADILIQSFLDSTTPGPYVVNRSENAIMADVKLNKAADLSSILRKERFLQEHRIILEFFPVALETLVPHWPGWKFQKPLAFVKSSPVPECDYYQLLGGFAENLSSPYTLWILQKIAKIALEVQKPSVSQTITNPNLQINWHDVINGLW